MIVQFPIRNHSRTCENISIRVAAPPRLYRIRRIYRLRLRI